MKHRPKTKGNKPTTVRDWPRCPRCDRKIPPSVKSHQNCLPTKSRKTRSP